MLEWRDYIQRLLAQKSSFDGITMSFGTGESVDIPPIIKASILMLDRMQRCQGKRNILVFPERVQSIFVFTVAKLLHNIFEGRIDRTYDPNSFKPGEKLRIGKAVVEFICIEERKDFKGKFMRLRTKDTIYSTPLELLPLFQRTNAERISTSRLYDEEREKAKRELGHISRDERHLRILLDYRTHMDSSIVNMTSIINAKEMINSCKICGHSAKELLLVGQADYSGQVKNIGAGQLGGTPAIVLASDLYAIAALVRSGHPVQSIIIDASNVGALQNQMDALDELLRLDVPITCVTDIVNSFELNQFVDRGFNLWRWDETSITSELYEKCAITADQKTKNCVKKSLRYLLAEGHDISNAVRILSSHRSESDTMSAPMLKLFEKLFSITFDVLREIKPFDSQYKVRVCCVLDECTAILREEKSYLSQEAYDDYVAAIECIRKAVAVSQSCPKYDMLLNHLIENRYRSICIIVPEGSDKKSIQEYWRLLCLRRRLPTVVNVLYPAEYYVASCAQYETAIVVGWMKRAIMRKILYSFNTESYVVLLYGCEEQWKNHATKRWNKALDRTQNRKVVEKSFATDKFQVSVDRFVQEPEPVEESPATDEYAEIEVTLRDNRFKQYIARGGHKHAGDTVEAVPVNYVGGYLAFYRTGHTVISATRIILDDADRIDTVLPEKLKLGDFVVVRESGKDLIKEMADAILERDGKADMRAMATKWREALIIEQLFSTPDEIYHKLKVAGCTKGFQTVRKWLFDDSIIAPQDKQDLEHIALVTESDVLKELNDRVFEAAQIVKSAHIHAGRALSVQLRSRIVESLNEYGDIDPFNIWEPIEMVVDRIGTVRVLKVIDIGAPVIVDISDTNRLITED